MFLIFWLKYIFIYIYNDCLEKSEYSYILYPLFAEFAHGTINKIFDEKVMLW